MDHSDFGEALVSLYMRLNGYFTSGLIVHSKEQGKNKTEIDCLAVRNRFHEQPERQVKCDPFLAIQPGYTDLIICEVKSGDQGQFNDSLHDPEILAIMLKWSGTIPPDQCYDVAKNLVPLLASDALAETVRTGLLIEEHRISIRPLICCLAAAEKAESWCLSSPTIFRFANECFNPSQRRGECSTKYSLNSWGIMEHIVAYIKARKEKCSLDELFNYCYEKVKTR